MTTFASNSAEEAAISASGSPSKQDWLIDARNVSKKYCRDLRQSLWYGAKDVLDAITLRSSNPVSLREHEFWAVENVSFQLRRGDALGLLGRNGAGKSTLLKMITGQRSLSTGEIQTRGRIVALNELGLGFNPILTGRENAYVNAAVHGFSRRRFDAIIDSVIDFAEIREFIDSAVQTYSTGMKARLGFAVATHLRPDILIVDEVLAVGDLDFRRKCVRHILGYIRGGGSLLLVAHDPYLVQSICNRCIVLDRGKLIFEGAAVEGVDFHFKLGHSKQYDSVVEAAERVLGDEVADADAERQLALSSDSIEETTPEPASFDLFPSSTQPVIIDRIEVLPEEGGELTTGKGARVAVCYRSNISLEVIWGFSFCTPDLQINIASCSSVGGQHSQLQFGQHKLLCRLPSLPLQAGVYAIRGGVAEAATQSAIAIRGYQDKPDFFTVKAAKASRASNFQMGADDLIAIDAEWSA